MTLFFLKRFFTLLITLWITSIVVFVVLDYLPGNAAQIMMGAEADPDALDALTRQLGLDQPPLTRYFHWINGLFSGDLGESYAYGTSVSELILERLSLTVPLTLLSMFLAFILALIAGVFAAAKHRSWGDLGISLLSQLGLAIPNFWLAILLILLFSVHLQWLPAGGFAGWDAGFWMALQSLLLPAFSLATVQAAVLTRITRSAVLEVLHEDFVRTARAKGLSRQATLYKHVLRNALIPIVTILGLQFANLLAGAIVIENVFSLPGLGRLMSQSIANRDVIVVRNGVLFLAALVVVVNFCVDIFHAWIDPRISIANNR